MSQATRSERNSIRPAFAGGRERMRTAGFALVALAITGGFVAGVEYVSRPDRFPVLAVSLQGKFARVTREQMMSAVGEQLRGNLFLLDLDAVQRRVEGLPWVHHASVRRQWPHTVQIFFAEQQLAARWGEKLYLNHLGEIVDLMGEPGPEGLPLLVGPAGTETQVLAHLRRLGQIARGAGLDIAELELSDQRTWRARLANNVNVLLGRQAPEERLARLMDVYGETVAGRVDYVRQVDLRYTNGFSVEWVRAAPAGVRNEG